MNVEEANRVHEGRTLADMAEAPRERMGLAWRVALFACLAVSVAAMGYLVGAMLGAMWGGV